jgi:hypothetical protein
MQPEKISAVGWRVRLSAVSQNRQTGLVAVSKKAQRKNLKQIGTLSGVSWISDNAQNRVSQQAIMQACNKLAN